METPNDIQLSFQFSSDAKSRGPARRLPPATRPPQGKSGKPARSANNGGVHSFLDADAAASDRDGYSAWLKQRKESMENLARRVGFPLGHEVDLWLADGVHLQGRLCLKEEQLFVPEAKAGGLELRIGRATFFPHEVESCVRVDARED